MAVEASLCTAAIAASIVGCRHELRWQTETQPSSSSSSSLSFTTIAAQCLVGGGSNAYTSALLNPFDSIKTRMQVERMRGDARSGATHGTVRSSAAAIVREGGLVNLWMPGLTATMLREMVNCSARTGLYVPVRDLLFSGDQCRREGSSRGTKKTETTLLEKIAAAMLTGTLGSVISNPTDVVKVRFLNGAGGELSSPRWFPTLAAYPALLLEEGAAGLLRGLTPSVLRGAFIAAGELATYDHCKGELRAALARRRKGRRKGRRTRGRQGEENGKKEGVVELGLELGLEEEEEEEEEGEEESPALHIVASLVTGVVATTVAAPFDLLKTRAMESRHAAASTLSVAREVLTTDGPRAVMRGWVPAYCRLGPHALICLPLFEQMRAFVGVGYM